MHQLHDSTLMPLPLSSLPPLSDKPLEHLEPLTSVHQVCVRLLYMLVHVGLRVFVHVACFPNSLEQCRLEEAPVVRWKYCWT